MQRNVSLQVRYRRQRVPSIVPAETVLARIGGEWQDTLSFTAAQRLADRVREVWLKLGYAIKVTVVPVGRQSTKHFAVRSDLVNGLPPLQASLGAR